MPFMDGYEASKKMRNLRKLCRVNNTILGVTKPVEEININPEALALEDTDLKIIAITGHV